MPWVRITDMLDVDPDLVLFTPEAVCWYVCATTWAARNLTDGLVPFAIAPTIKGWSESVMRDLLTKAMPRKEPWVVETDDGYLIRSFLKFNPSAEEVIKLREERAEAGRRGGFKKAENQANASKPLASARHELDLLPSKTLAKLCPVPVPVPDPIPEPSGKKAITLGYQEVVPLASERQLAIKHERDRFVTEIACFLNDAAGRKWSTDPKAHTWQGLRARWDGARVDQRRHLADACRLVILHKVSEWANDPKMAKYIRPETLFSTKFGGIDAEGNAWGYWLDAQEWDANGRRNAKGEQSWEDTFQVMIGGLK